MSPRWLGLALGIQRNCNKFASKKARTRTEEYKMMQTGKARVCHLEIQT